ncbi:MAG: TIGR02452 family protein [Deltaproteobacteria bacterium]|nr:TIGR02452 family protein [Deltaproteobacteria bacterium]
MDLVGVANETLTIVREGRYAVGGREVSVRDAIAYARDRTRVVRPGDYERLARPPERRDGGGARTTFEVVGASTVAAARQLVARGLDVAALSFGSATRPGGGFLGGAQAQEEDLARCSSLYECLSGATEYYDANRACGTALYTDHLVYSPRVPFFRDEHLNLVPDPFLVSILTSPAPNAAEVHASEPLSRASIDDVLYERGRQILLVAREHGHQALVLGAWGAGVFRNDPETVAAMWHYHLHKPEFAGAFQHVVFAIRVIVPNDVKLRVFREQFGVR